MVIAEVACIGFLNVFKYNLYTLGQGAVSSLSSYHDMMLASMIAFMCGEEPKKHFLGMWSPQLMFLFTQLMAHFSNCVSCSTIQIAFNHTKLHRNRTLKAFVHQGQRRVVSGRLGRLPWKVWSNMLVLY
jgi:hypothetical protein